MPIPTDTDLMRQIREQRADALEQMYDRYSRLVYSFARRACAEETMAREVVQLVFTRLWTTRAEFDAGRGAFSNWLVTMTRNIAIDVMRRERRHQGALPIDAAVDRALDDEPGNPETAALRRSSHSELVRASRVLSESQQRVIELLYWKGYTLQEIAEMGHEPIGTVKNRLHQALKTLRRHLQSLREEQ
ncbi:RNA polymerase sigma factor [Cohnella yongneupensis]|uniref:RNA polymerase sigma factor n=1 Tax=Cohnella yongneupensis TaxID=425006 RepID=A0ABW0R5D2_9BACL